jgi:hypothetical protein
VDLLVKQLERDRPANPKVVRAIDNTGSGLPQAALDLISIDRLADHNEAVDDGIDYRNISPAVFGCEERQAAEQFGRRTIDIRTWSQPARYH